MPPAAWAMPPTRRRIRDWVSAISFLRVPVAEHVLLHLAQGVARQVLDEVDPLGHLEVREPLLELRDHRGLVGALAFLARDDDGGYRLAEVGMRHADDRGLEHAR